MIKRTSRNFKVPLVSGGQWKDHQSFQKWDPVSKRLITVNCCLPAKCYQPEPVTNVTLTSMVGGSAIVSWNYSGPSNVLFEVNIYEGLTENVDTSGTPIYTTLNGTSGSTYYFTNTSPYYYVASVRVRNECLFSPYAYSSAVQYVFNGYQFNVVSTGAGNPGSGNLSLYSVGGSDYLVFISSTSKDSENIYSYLSQISTNTYIKLQKDPSNYIIFTRNTSTDNTSYWFYYCTTFASQGVLYSGDVATLTSS